VTFNNSDAEKLTMLDNSVVVNGARTFWMKATHNNVSLHSSLGQLTPVEFLMKYGKQENFPTFQRDNNNKFDWNYLVLNIAS